MIERHYSVRSASELLDIKEDTLRKMVQRRAITYAKVGGKLVRIPESSLQAIMEILPSVNDLTDGLLDPD